MIVDASGLEQFRQELRAFLDEHAPPKAENTERISVFSGFRDEPEVVAAAQQWQATMADHGFGAIAWPEQFGGRRAGPLEIAVFAEELSRFDLPTSIFSIGIGMIGPTLIAHGSSEQMDRYLRPMQRGDEIWCQLWSEPDAGSDLANLKTRLERDGDTFVLNGQKVWTSGAHYSHFGLGIFRSNPDVPKHKGISCCIVPMDAEGLTIRPLRQMTGGAHFNEVFFDDVRIPAANLVGDLDDGWRVARTTLMNERMAAGNTVSALEACASLLRLARAVGRGDGAAADDLVVRQAVADVYIRARLFDLTTSRVRSALERGGIPGPEVSVLKLAASQVFSDLSFVGVDLLGPAGALAGADAPQDGRWSEALLGSFAMHIGGGTDEIQRNIMGETVLGLPREPSVDRDVPFREVRT